MKEPGETTAKKIVETVRGADSPHTAAAACGIDPSTFEAWRARAEAAEQRHAQMFADIPELVARGAR